MQNEHADVTEGSLHRSEARFQALIDASAQIVWTTDAQGRPSEDSPSARAFTGQTPTQWQSAGIFSAVHPLDRVAADEEWRRCLTTGSPLTSEYRLFNAERGEYRWTRVRVVPLRGPDGSVEGWLGANLDITDRKAAEAARIHFHALFETAPGPYLVLTPQRFEIVAASDAYLQATHTTREQLLARSLFDAFPDDPDDPHASGVMNLRASLERVRREHRSDVMPVQRYPIRVPHSGGTRFEERYWCPLNSPVLGPDGELIYIIHRVEDVTPFLQTMREQQREAEAHRLLERRTEQLEADILLRAADIQHANDALTALNTTLERRVSERTEQVRRLASTLTMAEQEERRRISQILHDDLQQLLYGIQLKVNMIRRDVPSEFVGPIAARADEASAWIDRAITITRRLTVELSPPILKNEGLADALRWLRTQMAEMHSLDVELHAAHPFRIASEDMRVLLFQIVRELLFNVVKHAQTDRCRVELEETDGDLVIAVIDQGRGFDPSARAADETDSFGLQNLRERLSLFGGRLELQAAPGGGTRALVRLPASISQSEVGADGSGTLQ